MKAFAVLLVLTASAPSQTLVGWNNLGMHCMDDDYSVFSILPPYNTINAQLIDVSGNLVRNPKGITVTYRALRDPDGSINRSSTAKTTFWDHSQALFGATLPTNTGLTGKKMPGSSNTPQMMDFNGVRDWFEALGVPIVPIDDAGHSNTYPMMRLTAQTTSGTILATTDIVLPVSGEMDCRKCHGSNSGDAAKPEAGWVNLANPSRDYRLNILRLHDEKNLGTQAYTDALAANSYSAAGLYSNVIDQHEPVLCAACHSSEALGTAGAAGVDPLTRSMHSRHADVIAPDTGLSLDNSSNRNSCYQCHPGSSTRCLRGAMGSSVAADGSAAIQCQSCHGNMSAVGASTRTGWLNEPQCGSCHTGDAVQNRGQLRFTTVFQADKTVRTPVVGTFATNPDTPAAGVSLYRFSKGHGDLQCSACHGSTHAEYPSHKSNDNLQNQKLQGHAGVLANCTTCHTTMPRTSNGGPHGMHSIDSRWATGHGDLAEGKGKASCQKCHGTDYRGTPLSRVLVNHTVTTRFGKKTFTAGREVGCYDCHNGSGGEGISKHAPPVVSSNKLQVPANGSAGLKLTASGNSPDFRILRQPAHGSVALSGNTATYHPDAGFKGPDSFLVTASDHGGYIDAMAPAIVSVNVGKPDPNLDTDGDKLTDIVEYALGLSPDFPTSGKIQTPYLHKVGGKNYLTLSIPRAPSPPDARVFVEFSSNHKTWVAGKITTNTPYLLRVRDTLPTTKNNPRYVRIRAQR